MKSIALQIGLLNETIKATLHDAQRKDDDICIVAVCKTRSTDEIIAAKNAGISHVGENHVQEALDHQQQLASNFPDISLIWHFIGTLQRNKTRKIAEHFSWVDSVDRKEIAARLNEQRPSHLPPLNICIQVNIDHDPNKSGVMPDEVKPLAEYIAQQCPRLRLRGLMTVPQKATTPEQTRESFQRLKEIYDRLCEQGFALDTLSMGMSNDYVEAIKAGATMIRIGTGIFGERTRNI